MITDIQIRVACDHMPTCQPFLMWHSGCETDHDAVEAALIDEGWIVTDLAEHICPGCAYAWTAERRAEKTEAERDAYLDDPRYGQAAGINRELR